MALLDNLVIVGVRSNPSLELIDLEKGITHYSLNLWRASQPGEPHVIPVPYRGGYIGGFNHVTTLDQYLLVAEGKSILAIDLIDLTKGYAELTGVNEVSEYICETSDYLVSCLNNLIQIRSLEEITNALQQAAFANEHVEVPYREIQHEGKGSTALSMIPIDNDGNELALLNNAADKTYLIDPRPGQAHKVGFSSKQDFPYTFQRREQFHLIQTEPSKHLVFTESTSDDKHPNRVYSFDIRGPPTIIELEPLELEGRQILSMLPSNKDLLPLLTRAC